MNKHIKINLSVNDLSNTVKRLNKLNRELKNLPDKLSKKIANDGLKKLNEYYENGNKDENINVSSIERTIEKSQDGYKIVARGRDVLYEEFGTGDEGQNSPHPEKSKFNLNDYNSGKYIINANETSAAHGITTGKYWTYKKNDTIHYTQGVPAGKEVFNTRNYIKDDGIKKSKEKVVGDMLSKL